jgi:hypothetical protein
MSVFTGRGLVLVLAVPMALYAAWQVNGVARSDLVLADPPPDRGPTKEQLAEASKKAANWAAEVRTVTGFAEQYRTDAAAAGGPDKAAAAVVRAAAARSAVLTDLDQFLSGLERPTFNGRMKALYQQWLEQSKDLKRDAAAVAAWLARPPAVASAADARAALKAVTDDIDTYAGRSKFSDKAKAAAWRLQARLAVIRALKELADRQYRDAVRERLPLEAGTNGVKPAVETHREIGEQIVALGADRRAADEEKAALDPKTRTELDRAGAIEDECAAREKLLGLFARDDLFTNPNGAAAWLKQVAGLYGRTKNEEVRALIRKKVQEFCEAFVPAAVRLDDQVLFFGRSVPRRDVVVKYYPTVDGKVEKKVEPLAGTLDGVNEFNLESKHPGPNTFAMYDGAERRPAELKPTRLSAAARAFDDERKKVADGTTGPKWTAKSVEGLKKTFADQKDLVDQIQTPDSTNERNPPKIWTRLSGLAAGMAACPDLFE